MTRSAGADFGTTRTKVAVLSTSGEPQIQINRENQTFMPSVVHFGENPPLVGTAAENAALADPSRAVYDWKRHMGSDVVLYSDGNRQWRAQDILEILMRTVKADVEAKLGEPVNDIVITVPANYTNAQKQQTTAAAEAVGLNVRLMLHEPTAAALGNGVHKLRRGIVLVFDLGGGTFDVSILKARGNVCEVIGTGGIPKLGGRDFNARVEEKVVEAFEARHGYRPDEERHAIFYQDVKSRVEQLKVNLSAQSQASVVLSCNGDVLNMPVTRDEFENWVGDLVEQAVEQTEKVLSETGLSWDDIDAIYRVGGGSMMPIVTRRLEEVSGKKVSVNCEAHCAAALGAAVAGRLANEMEGKVTQIGSVTLPPSGFLLKEILSRAVGVAVLNEDEKAICSEILAKDTPIPSVQTKRFKLAELGQTNARICILQGAEGDRADNCVDMGHFDLDDIPARPDVIDRIEVTFDLDHNGMLTASARDTVSNKRAELTVDREAVLAKEGGES